MVAVKIKELLRRLIIRKQKFCKSYILLFLAFKSTFSFISFYMQIGTQDYPLEVVAMNKLNHKYVIKLLDYVEDEEEVYIIMEKPDQCSDLCDLIQESGALEEHWARYLFRQLLIAIKYIHAEGVVHNDLKCENILIDLDVPQIKLIDFGFARFLTDVPLSECTGKIYKMASKLTMDFTYMM